MNKGRPVVSGVASFLVMLEAVMMDTLSPEIYVRDGLMTSCSLASKVPLKNDKSSELEGYINITSRPASPGH